MGTGGASPHVMRYPCDIDVMRYGVSEGEETPQPKGPGLEGGGGRERERERESGSEGRRGCWAVHREGDGKCSSPQHQDRHACKQATRHVTRYKPQQEGITLDSRTVRQHSTHATRNTTEQISHALTQSAATHTTFVTGTGPRNDKAGQRGAAQQRDGGREVEREREREREGERRGQAWRDVILM